MAYYDHSLGRHNDYDDDEFEPCERPRHKGSLKLRLLLAIILFIIVLGLVLYWGFTRMNDTPTVVLFNDSTVGNISVKAGTKVPGRPDVVTLTMKTSSSSSIQEECLVPQGQTLIVKGETLSNDPGYQVTEIDNCSIGHLPPAHRSAPPIFFSVYNSGSSRMATPNVLFSFTPNGPGTYSIIAIPTGLQLQPEP